MKPASNSAEIYRLVDLAKRFAVQTAHLHCHRHSSTELKKISTSALSSTRDLYKSTADKDNSQIFEMWNAELLYPLSQIHMLCSCL